MLPYGMSNETKNVLEFYELTSALKKLIRTGWKTWDVSADRLESVAEHVFSSSMLALAVNSEFNYNVDIKKVVYMLAVHELEEIVIGDITPFDGVTKADKRIKGKAAVAEVLSKLSNPDDIAAVIEEYEKLETREAKFATFVDKLDAGLQCRQYERDGAIDLHSPKINQKRIDEYNKSGRDNLTDYWLDYAIANYGFDENFVEIAKSAQSPRAKKERLNIADVNSLSRQKSNAGSHLIGQ